MIEDLSLLLMYLTAFTEKAGDQTEAGDQTVLRTWKNYSFEAVDSLVDKALISTRHGNKSAYISEEGVRRAKDIAVRLGIEI